MVERRLGRGLDFFLTEKTPLSDGPVPTDGAIAQIQVDKLIPNPDQPRRDFREPEILELAESIRSSGLLQPVLARRRGDAFQIIAGERRWRAAKSIGLERIPVIVREITDEQAAVFGLVENLHRADLNPVEKARAFRQIQEITSGSTEEVAQRVGLERSTVANFIRLLELPNDVLAHVSRGTLTMGHARALLGLADSSAQTELAEEVIRERLSVREVEALVQGLRDGVKPPKTDAAGKPEKRQPDKDAWVKECEDNIAEALGTPVSIRYGRRKSKITIECAGRDEFERVYDQLTGRSR